MPWNRVLAGTAVGGVLGLAALAGRVPSGWPRARRSRPAQVEAGLRDLGEADEVSILPLAERLTGEGSGLRGEPGVSYLVSADGRRVLSPGYGLALISGCGHPRIERGMLVERHDQAAAT